MHLEGIEHFSVIFCQIRTVIVYFHISEQIAIQSSLVFVMKCALLSIPRVESFLIRTSSVVQDDIELFSHLNNISFLTGYGMG